MAAAPSLASAAAPAAMSLRGAWRDRRTLITGATLLVVTALAWAGVVAQAEMGMGLPAGPATASDLLMFVTMWGVMMAAMMLPSATPMIALYGLVRRGQRAVPTALFAATYVAAWLLTGIPVYVASVVVHTIVGAGVGAGVGMERTPWMAYLLAVVLVTAGAYQFTSIKRVCLTTCQNPLAFMMHRWRQGYRATLGLGLAHAGYCIGCCWGLMVVLVAAGAMSLPWVLTIALAVFAEKLLPARGWTARLIGVTLLFLGVAVAIRPDLALALSTVSSSNMTGLEGMYGMSGMSDGSRTSRMPGM